jgi:hypothetical protein
MTNDIIPRRVSADLDGDFVVFLIGMRINRPWKVHKWWPVLRAMRPMLAELASKPESGFLGATFGFPVIVQYWRSFEHLEAYARDHSGLHWPAWVAFNKRTADSRGDVGIWHETYRVGAGQYESIYSGMPPFGLGKFATLVSANGKRETARGRVAAKVEQQQGHQAEAARALQQLEQHTGSARTERQRDNETQLVSATPR